MFCLLHMGMKTPIYPLQEGSIYIYIFNMINNLSMIVKYTSMRTLLLHQQRMYYLSNV